MLRIDINDIEVTDWYSQAAGAATITDALNQPVTLDIAMTALGLPVSIIGGETVSVYDENNIYFDGIVPVESGLGTEFLYLDSLASPEAYRKAIKVSATDYQSALDFSNLPNKIYYFQTAGQIVKDLLANSILAGLVNIDAVMDGYAAPEFDVSGRKFSNVVKDLSGSNGFYFSLRTTSLSPRRFKAEFRSIYDRPAPLSIDRDANTYVLSTLKFDPRNTPLMNKITVIGGQEPSLDVVTDVFGGDPEVGHYQLSRVPFYMKTNNLLQSDFSQPLDGTPTGSVSLLGTAMSAGDTAGVLQISGSGAMYYKTPFQSRNQRYTTFEDIGLDTGASVVFGIFHAIDSADPSNCKLGVWFKPDGSISYIRNGVETLPMGSPWWNERNTATYAVRIKESEMGTYAEVQGGQLSPVRHWYPLQPPGDVATGDLKFTNTSGDDITGTRVSVSVGPIQTLKYIVTAEDNSSLNLLHRHITELLNGTPDFAERYSADAKWGGAAAIVSVTPPILRQLFYPKTWV